ncbi:hypothetical protein HOD30_01825 [Candidatus Peregrinibacteria bacterium]|jgi:hypothetical protein|nr:hypothetical protein [Candidatus Peregrinibacteria bacterium]MBT4632088.1 hypothetical protein [Candidatus Peregrinibacteria bacterium]MBT5516602.1 hypothetical protein [Candidatus Peregrinibacteria bacterium]MBT5823506.1 hypothetical protein [Candidatus Peregrinibacteria bacterium]
MASRENAPKGGSADAFEETQKPSESFADKKEKATQIKESAHKKRAEFANELNASGTDSDPEKEASAKTMATPGQQPGVAPIGGPKEDLDTNDKRQAIIDVYITEHPEVIVNNPRAKTDYNLKISDDGPSITITTEDEFWHTDDNFIFATFAEAADHSIEIIKTNTKENRQKAIEEYFASNANKGVKMTQHSDEWDQITLTSKTYEHLSVEIKQDGIYWRANNTEFNIHFKDAANEAKELIDEIYFHEKSLPQLIAKSKVEGVKLNKQFEAGKGHYLIIQLTNGISFEKILWNDPSLDFDAEVSAAKDQLETARKLRKEEFEKVKKTYTDAVMENTDNTYETINISMKSGLQTQIHFEQDGKWTIGHNLKKYPSITDAVKEAHKQLKQRTKLREQVIETGEIEGIIINTKTPEYTESTIRFTDGKKSMKINWKSNKWDISGTSKNYHKAAVEYAIHKLAKEELERNKKLKIDAVYLNQFTISAEGSDFPITVTSRPPGKFELATQNGLTLAENLSLKEIQALTDFIEEVMVEYTGYDTYLDGQRSDFFYLEQGDIYYEYRWFPWGIGDPEISAPIPKEFSEKKEDLVKMLNSVYDNY